MAQVLVSQFPSQSNPGSTRDNIKLYPDVNQKDHHLPDIFTSVPAVTLKTAQISVPNLPKYADDIKGHLDGAKSLE